MAGTVPGFSLTPQFDKLGVIAPGAKLYIIEAGTVSTPQDPYQDTALTILQTNPVIADSAGRLLQWFVADGSIKLRLTDRHGTEIFVQDNLLVLGASSSGGGGGTVDPTTIFATGDLKARYGTGVLDGFVRGNGRTIGSATSGASERANLDCQALFEYLWNTDGNLSVSAGRGASANADWTANKTIALPDWRGRALAFLDDMGNSAAGRLTAAYWGVATGSLGTTLGAAGGKEFYTTLTANLPAYTPSGTLAGTPATITSSGNNSISVSSAPSGKTFPANTVASSMSNAGGSQLVQVGGSSSNDVISSGTNSISVSASYTPAGTLTGSAQGGSSTPFPVSMPSMLATVYVKL